MKLRYIFPVALAMSGTPALAERGQPADALPLPALIAGLEGDYNIQFIDEITWHDAGYWAVEFFTSDGAHIALALDPVTGAPLR